MKKETFYAHPETKMSLRGGGTRFPPHIASKEVVNVNIKNDTPIKRNERKFGLRYSKKKQLERLMSSVVEGGLEGTTRQLQSPSIAQTLDDINVVPKIE